jgi:hypothetical protein
VHVCDALSGSRQPWSFTPNFFDSIDQNQSGLLDRHRSTPVGEPVNSSRRSGQLQSSSISSLISASNLSKPATSLQVEEQAIAIYNQAARQHGFTECSKLTDARCQLLKKRLRDIGGIDAFERALSAIGRNDFLMGRVRPKDGCAAYKLDLDALLRTDGKMGDVLARLLNMADPAATSKLSVEDEARELACGVTGQELIAKLGSEVGMQRLREIVTQNRRNRGLA